MSTIEDYIKIVPSTRQKKVQRESFNIFVHYGLNTFTGKEWGDGKTPAKLFNPKRQDTDQWARTAKAMGAFGMILTCKHHDGFCLWQTKTTEYSVASSPYKEGKGDVVKELSDSCKKYGLKFGVYLSPWDRNHPTYSTPEYNDVYAEQICELLTNYGDIFCVWFDGACGAHMDGKTRQKYDWDRFFGLIRELQPNALLSDCAPDIRWVGNEGGIARASEWNVVPEFAADIQTIQSKSQQTEDNSFLTKTADIVCDDLGSREFLANYDKFMWYPAEVNVSTRPGWFWHAAQDNAVRSLENLLRIYYTSVGGNSLFLLNIPPNTDGLFAKSDVIMAEKFGSYLNTQFNTVKVAKITAPIAAQGCAVENVLDGDYNAETYDPIAYYTPKEEAQSYTIELTLEKQTLINRVKIVENCAFSQRIEKFNVYALLNGSKIKVYNGTTVGYGRIAVFNKPVLTDKLIIEIAQSRHKPYIEYIAVYESDGYKLKKNPLEKLVAYFHHKGYKGMIKREMAAYKKFMKTQTDNK